MRAGCARIGFWAGLFVVALPALGASPLAAAAQRQGSLGPTSQASIGISLSIAQSARVSTSADVPIPASDRGDTHVQPFCLWSTVGSRPYKVTAYGSGRFGAFALAHPARPALTYGLRWRDEPMQASTPIPVEAKSFANARQIGTQRECRETIALAFRGPSRPAAGEGEYAGYLTFIAAPE